MTSMGVHELGPMLTASEVASLLHLHVNTVKRLGVEPFKERVYATR